MTSGISAAAASVLLLLFVCLQAVQVADDLLMQTISSQWPAAGFIPPRTD